MHLVITSQSLSTLTDITAPTFFHCLIACEVPGGLVDAMGDLFIEVKPGRVSQVISLLTEFRLEWEEAAGPESGCRTVLN